MATHSIETELQKYFSKSVRADWERFAMQELNGKNPFENLSWRGKDDILFLPYFDSSKDADLHFLEGFQLPAAQNSSPRTWLNIPHVGTENTERANDIALDHLAQGAEGIVFDLLDAAATDLNKLTHNIEWPYCHIAFYLPDTPGTLQSITSLIQNKFDPASIQGALFWESIPKKNHPGFYFNGNKNLKALGLLIHASTPAQEISGALFEGVKLFETFSEEASPENVFYSICFSLSADASFLETVAKFKALRMLWFQIAHAYGHTSYRAGDLFIHARVVDQKDEEYAPRENMLRATFASIAATLGGCNSLTIESASHDPLFARWSRNVSNVLREESFLDQKADPLAGAWAIDSITNDIAAKAWQMFQEKWRVYAS